MKNDEIRMANRKALPKFLGILGLLLIVSLAAGYLAERCGLSALTGTLRRAGAFFGEYVAAWAMAALAVLLPAVCVPLYRRIKQQIAVWDGEDDVLYGKIDGGLSVIVWITSAALILTYFLMAASYSGGTALFESRERTARFFLSIAALFIVMAEGIVIQQKCVDAAKTVDPGKTASVYDMKFQKKWVESCDEAEKIRIGRCAFKAHSVMQRVCAILAGVLAVGALLFDTGFLPSGAVCLVWLIEESVYCREAIRYSRAGNRIS